MPNRMRPKFNGRLMRAVPKRPKIRGEVLAQNRDAAVLFRVIALKIAMALFLGEIANALRQWRPMLP